MGDAPRTSSRADYSVRCCETRARTVPIESLAPCTTICVRCLTPGLRSARRGIGARRFAGTHRLREPAGGRLQGRAVRGQSGAPHHSRPSRSCVARRNRRAGRAWRSLRHRPVQWSRYSMAAADAKVKVAVVMTAPAGDRHACRARMVGTMSRLQRDAAASASSAPARSASSAPNPASTPPIVRRWQCRAVWR